MTAEWIPETDDPKEPGLERCPVPGGWSEDVSPDITFCEGKGPDDPGCLEKNPPEGKQMIFGHMCGAGCDKFGTCKAIFANPEERPDLFEPPG